MSTVWAIVILAAALSGPAVATTVLHGPVWGFVAGFVANALILASMRRVAFSE